MKKPSLLREVAKQAVQQRTVSIRLACSAVGISETCYRYQSRLIINHGQANKLTS